MIDFLRYHMFQPDYYQFYLIIFLGLLYLEHNFRRIRKILVARWGHVET